MSTALEVTPHTIGGLLCLAAMVPALALLAWALLSKGADDADL